MYIEIIEDSPSRKAQEGLQHLLAARECFAKAESPRTLQRVVSAISSAKGAVRAAGYREARRAVPDAGDLGGREIPEREWVTNPDHNPDAEG